MRIQPRQHLLDIWRATAKASWRDRQWMWGGRDGANSLSDAEQLLCILLPATQLPIFALDQPDTTSNRVAEALRVIGDVHVIPATLVRVLTQYFRRYSDENGRPTFAGGSYFNASSGEAPTPEQARLDIVDSFAVSVTLSLATIGFSRVYRETPQQPEDLRTEIQALEGLAAVRLTAAMVGLLRSFAVSTFPVDSTEGSTLLRTVNQENSDEEKLAQRLRDALQETTASLGEVLIGSGQVTTLRERPNDLYECGWSWGVIKDAPEIEVEDKSIAPKIEQPKGVAQNAPYLYFTVLALDAIEDLFSERTRVLNLLNEEQQRLTRALQLRWDLTRRYWATVATFGNGARWPIEDIPWRTTDLDESDYYTLLVTSAAVKGLAQERGSDVQLSRIGAVLSELAQRARVTRRPAGSDDSAQALHSPGVELTLVGSEIGGGERLRWPVSEFSSLLLQRSVVIATLIRDVAQRERMLNLADQAWAHLAVRRLSSDVQLWDQPAEVFPGAKRHEKPSWYYTERVVQALVSAAKLLIQEPLVDPDLTEMAAAMLAEAEHLYDMELMNGSVPSNVNELGKTLIKIRMHLERGRQMARTRPGTTVALASESLRLLDELASARQENV
ncbi:SCO2524 family protein [Solwaraspora sp. WMMD792]|uniref:SCO2524 family protein n=1 Tax=Solwaraspora sp. WMMD792 TaxID=3016099 RepID=UPI0024168481|nr:SCO2524 family protein [Solwaraspora sp. WMMD792]MDG4772706.1 SCO2524 family protein [Solwaraspora sp. WMMD792]